MNVRELVLASLNPAPVAVEVEGWGTVYVRILTAGEVTKAQEENKNARGGDKPTIARFVARALCNEDGTRVFDVNNKADVDSIMDVPWTMVMKFVTEANRVNGVETAGNP